MGNRFLEEEKARIGNYYGHDDYFIDNLEEKIPVLFIEDFNQSNPSSDGGDHFTDDDDDESSNHGSIDSMERTSFWEAQEALLQEVFERNSLTGSKLRQEVGRIIEQAKKISFCNCHNEANCSPCLRRRVLHLLSEKGFHASLCTSKWKHTKKFPGGKHEYIELIASTQGRKKQITYLIELEFRDQFKIAKACEEYRKLLVHLPEYYIGKPDYLNAIVRVLCDAAKRSMKEKNLHMGPWRKRRFMQMKWSSSFERRHSLHEPSLNISQFSTVPAVAVT